MVQLATYGITACMCTCGLLDSAATPSKFSVHVTVYQDLESTIKVLKHKERQCSNIGQC